MPNHRILAVVVTYNRFELLKRCVVALQHQTCKDFDVLIVNNGSTDGTKEWINSLPTSILRIHQENLGGAGGFHAGQKYSYENGYEWVWMMDDDGVPAPNQLEELMKVVEANNLKVAGPLVVNIDNPEEQAFYPGHPSNEVGKDQISWNTKYVCPFNGIIYHRSIIEKIGFICKDLFIWGDEREYTLRLRKNGYKEAAALKAIHYHPKIKATHANVFPWTTRYRITIKPQKFSKYYYRNNGYINRKYNSFRTLILEGAMYSFYFIRVLDLGEWFKFIWYYTKGAFSNFNVR